MKLLVNISSIIIMVLSFSSITSAQGQQRPSQRSFATVLSKIKEKKSGRDKMQQERNQQPEEKVEVIDPTNTTNTTVNNTQIKPPPGSGSNNPHGQLPSRQLLLVPRKTHR
jgi:hypothetical protein